MPRTVISSVVVVALGYLALCTFVFVLQRQLIYFPTPRPPGGGPSTLTLNVDGTRIQVTLRPRRGTQAILYFGGNAEDVTYSLDHLAAAFPQHALYLMHYRGYGGSEGRPSEAGLMADALALYDHVRADHPDIVVVGRSLGSGIALPLAAARPVARLVLVTPFDSLLALARRQFPFLPVRWLLLDRYESWRQAPKIDTPTVVIAADHDEIIPRARTLALLGHFRPGVATLQVLDGTGHNTISDSPGYLPLLGGAVR